GVQCVPLIFRERGVKYQIHHLAIVLHPKGYRAPEAARFSGAKGNNLPAQGHDVGWYDLHLLTVVFAEIRPGRAPTFRLSASVVLYIPKILYRLVNWLTFFITHKISHATAETGLRARD